MRSPPVVAAFEDEEGRLLAGTGKDPPLERIEGKAALLRPWF